MKTVSPYAYASILILMRIFAVSMYMPSEGENAAVTAICAVVLSALKLISFIPLFILFKRGVSPQNRVLIRVGATSAAVVSAAFLLIINDLFSTAVESVYPDRFTKIGITAALFFIAAYVASMGVQGVSRACSICAVTFAVMLVVVMVEMRSCMANDRIDLYSRDLGGEAAATAKNLLAFLGDYFVFFALLPYLKSSPQKAAGIYATADMILSLVFFLMCASVMGGFYPRSGFSFFTLSYCTQGSMIDRADGIFLAISAACAIVSCAAMMTVLKDSLRYLFNKGAETGTYLASAAVLTAAALSMINFKVSAGKYSLPLGVISAIAIFTASAAAAFLKRRRRAK